MDGFSDIPPATTQVRNLFSWTNTQMMHRPQKNKQRTFYESSVLFAELRELILLPTTNSVFAIVTERHFSLFSLI